MKFLAVLAGIILVACNNNPDTCSGKAPYAVAGPLAVGVTTLEVDGALVEVWYPAPPSTVKGRDKASYDLRDALPESERAKIPDDPATLREMNAYRDVPVATSKRWPLILFSHGFSGTRMQSTFLMTHLASWGYVVVSPEHTAYNLAAILEGRYTPDDVVGTPPDNAPMLNAVIARMTFENARADGPFFDRVDTESVAVSGHSLGGFSVGQVDAKAWVAYSSFVAPQNADIPGLVMGGTADQTVPNALTIGSFDNAPQADKELVILTGAGHLSFTDICVTGETGIDALATAHGIDWPAYLDFANECAAPLANEDAYRAIRSFTVEHYKRVLDGNDPNQAAAGCFASFVDEMR